MPFAAGLILLMALVAAGTVRTGQILRTWTPSFNLLLSPPDTLLRLALIGVGAGLGYVFGPGSTALGWSLAHFTHDVALGAAAGLLMAGVLALTGQAVERRWGPVIYEDKLLRCILPAGRREWPGVLLALLPAAALEELLFRSLPLGGLAQLVAPHWLMWPLALLFGLLHWPQGGWGVVGTTVTAVALSLLFLVTGGVWAPLAAHYVLNVLQIVLARWMGMQPLRAP